MRLRDSAKVRVFSGFLALFSVYFPTFAHAKDKYFDEQPQCPLVVPLRVAAATSLGDFQSLKGCMEQMVFAPPATLESQPPVVRIIGVKATSPAALKPAPDPQAGCRGCMSSSARNGDATPHRSALAYDGLIRQAAGTYRIDPLFLHALTWTESSYRPTAISSAGARGLMQIMPNTGRGLGVAQEHLFDPRINVDAGARLLKKLQRRYGRDIPLILAAYNAGEGAVERYGRQVPPYRETQNYVRTVMQRYGTLRGATSSNRELAR